MRFTISKAYAAPAGGRGSKPTYTSSPTSAGTSSGGGTGSRGGKSLGNRPDGTPVYETELKQRSGKGHSTGNQGNTFKEAQENANRHHPKQKQHQRYVVPRKDSRGSEKPARDQKEKPDSQNSDREQALPEHTDKYHHTGIGRGKSNYQKVLVDHNGTTHTILHSKKGEDGKRYYTVHSSDTGGLSKIDAEHLHGYVEHMDKQAKKKDQEKEVTRQQKAAHKEFLRRSFTIEVPFHKSMSPVDAKDNSTRPGEFVIGGMWADGENKVTPNKNKVKGGKADKKSEEDFDPEALKEGMKVEMEHTSDPKIAKEIAMDHLTEDPRYYIALKKMERDLESSKKPVEKSFVIYGV